MKPDWDKLMAEYKNHDSILIADVDCTAEGKDLCEKVGVEGFPTIKYGDPNNLEMYEGDRSLKALNKFAKDNLGPTCGPTNLELCDADTKKMIDEFMAMPDEKLGEFIDKKNDELKGAEAEFKELVESLNTQYEEGQKKTEDTKKEIKQGGLGLMKSVLASRKDAVDEF